MRQAGEAAIRANTGYGQAASRRRRTQQPALFRGDGPLAMDEAIEMTAVSLRAYGEEHGHWAVAWSGGKDSTATLTLLIHLLEEGRAPRPRSLTVLYADTRQELPPLYAAALGVMKRLRAMGGPRAGVPRSVG